MPEAFLEHAETDYGAHTISIDIGKFSPHLLVLEATLFCQRNVEVREGRLVLPEISGIKMLTNFYGFLPRTAATI
jgi:hypothetical protein